MKVIILGRVVLMLPCNKTKLNQSISELTKHIHKADTEH